MNRLILSALALALALCVAPAARAQNGSAPASGSAPVAFAMGFVDMEKLIREHPATKSKTEGFRREFEVRMEDLRIQVSTMNELRATLGILEPGSPAHLAQLKRIKKLEATLELEKEIIRIEFQLKVVSALQDVYGRCKAVVKQVAEKRGFRAIAMISESKVQGRTRSEVVGDILTRPFIYADESLDITDDVLAILKGK